MPNTYTYFSVLVAPNSAIGCHLGYVASQYQYGASGNQKNQIVKEKKVRRGRMIQRSLGRHPPCHFAIISHWVVALRLLAVTQIQIVTPLVLQASRPGVASDWASFDNGQPKLAF